MNEAIRTRLLEMMQRHGIGYLDYAGPDGTLTIEADRPDMHAPVLADRPGIFLTRHPAETAPPAPAWPRRVTSGEVIGWLKIGPLLVPVRATETAVIGRPHLDDGALAGFGDRLF